VTRPANRSARADLGTMMRGIENETLQAPVTNTQQIVAALNGLPLNLFAGQQEQGSQTNTETTKSASLGGSLSFGPK
jgi:hypothetical protein